ncbi:hypothetical protein EPIR_1039 [Erwinia piriflorinigrans CFBP 5888]|uniref:Uncharacterized protein n=1 Tax=Erwinia piriflorinigrans CFBP 5888 TaxID=1161919 RepID=V5Z605_9GAMM|nr:hypothetical protein EPIR_1039 [Erwinia piriflorinigrans CFBP 5888]
MFLPACGLLDQLDACLLIILAFSFGGFIYPLQAGIMPVTLVSGE